jgi:hypothetical protein
MGINNFKMSKTEEEEIFDDDEEESDIDDGLPKKRCNVVFIGHVGFFAF